ncbi:IS3 family transposase, partial [Odoribacter sp. OttesenSCG-928-A06]|nr:IS3 family transposase [Odoribacter sp. OttesenSCG-928-A06]
MQAGLRAVGDPEVRKALISPCSGISISRQCRLLHVNRSSYYYRKVDVSASDLELMSLLDREHLAHPHKGVRGMVDTLRLLGFLVGPKRIRRLLRKMGLHAIYPKRNLSRLGLNKYIHSYKLRGMDICRCNQVWSIDITYIPMERGFLYLTAIIDVYSRYVVAWNLSNTLDAENSLSALREAIAYNGKPEILNSDQGSQYTCNAWVEYLTEQEIVISMDGKGRALDNIWIERFWRTIKYEYIYLNPAENGIVLQKGIREFIEYYNDRRAHQ